ncbi:hypothetical protein PO181_07020 [Leuconostoc suionicum]|uniref:hypothetical protein n=1 Tax=Leuconostoc suionicum TaxID=1511761 RepID=UPI00233E8A53|nr:hypothetical protein [Leuconostoc suionicum]MDC2816733.1 hypothetical protein [Leuconostoc suionicum]
MCRHVLGVNVTATLTTVVTVTLLAVNLINLDINNIDIGFRYRWKRQQEIQPAYLF